MLNNTYIVVNRGGFWENKRGRWFKIIKYSSYVSEDFCGIIDIETLEQILREGSYQSDNKDLNLNSFWLVYIVVSL